MTLEDNPDLREEIAALQQVVAGLARKLDASASGDTIGGGSDPHKIVRVATDLRRFGWQPKQLKETK